MNDKAANAPRRWLKPSTALNRFKPPPRSITPSIAPAERRRARYGFRIGGIGLLIGQDTTSEVLEQASIYPIPNTPPWFLGLVNLRGNLVPIFDTKQFLELADGSVKGEKRRLLILDQGDKVAGILIDGLPQVAMTSHALSRLPPLPTALRNHVAGAYAQDDVIWLEFDHQGFFQALGGRIAGAA
ncbi:MAG TPA: chemotaxis protein CheW [Candidatus Competibacter sp.]|nr:chemotaxis protein CheW [Candidatus Competibacter sp.]